MKEHFKDLKEEAMFIINGEEEVSGMIGNIDILTRGIVFHRKVNTYACFVRFLKRYTIMRFIVIELL